ncbi:MAG: hypothetical protein PHO02_01570 [Candidatus Nanoarchaeia archaeon]|nr:hypothetical protein [Candidatus Nanoarchaeia archaeon]
MRNRFINKKEDDGKIHNKLDYFLMGVALVGGTTLGLKCLGVFDPAEPKRDSNAVPRENIIYMDTDNDGDLDSVVRSREGVMFELKYDEKGNPYVERNPFAFEVDFERPYQEQKQNALNAGSR